MLGYIGCAALGVVLWSLYEYLNHRFMHSRLSGRLRREHCGHHARPTRLSRLPVKPMLRHTRNIVAAAVVMAFLFSPGHVAVAAVFALLSGLATMEVHWRAHNSANPGALLMHHLEHHSTAGANFGIITTFWDHLLGTRVRPLEERIAKVQVAAGR